MIITPEITALTQWCEENRGDKESKKPYFIAREVDGKYHLPEDYLIEKGLNELKLTYLKLVTVSGAQLAFSNNPDYNEWEARFDAVSQCKALVNSSPIVIEHPTLGLIPLRAMIMLWYEGAMFEISNFILTGDNSFLQLIEDGNDFWWDAAGTNGTVREQAVGLIKDLVV